MVQISGLYPARPTNGLSGRRAAVEVEPEDLAEVVRRVLHPLAEVAVAAR
jgi:hypothetical protein